MAIDEYEHICSSLLSMPNPLEFWGKLILVTSMNLGGSS